jgi:hypothetical protein
MAHRLEVDRFEGPGKGLAVLLPESGDPFNVPRALLPEGAKEGDVLTVRFERDEEATKALRAELKQVQDDLKKTDPGGDLEL